MQLHSCLRIQARCMGLLFWVSAVDGPGGGAVYTTTSALVPCLGHISPDGDGTRSLPRRQRGVGRRHLFGHRAAHGNSHRRVSRYERADHDSFERCAAGQSPQAVSAECGDSHGAGPECSRTSDCQSLCVTQGPGQTTARRREPKIWALSVYV